MARGKKKDAAQAAPAPEATTPTPKEQEAHLDPGQFADMDDANLQQLARDMGLDPAAYEDREALTAAIASVPVTPGPQEAEGQEGTSGPQEGQEQPQEHGDAKQGEDMPQGQEGQQEGQEQPQEKPPEPVPITERPLPFRATVAAPVAILHRAVIGTADMLKPVATLDKGATVTVVAFEGNSARLANGLYIKASLLT